MKASMKRLFKAIYKVMPALAVSLTITIFTGIFQDFTFPFFWEDGIYQTLDEDDPPQKKPITPKD